MIVTPHAFHFAQATAALEAGLDVLLEKPMVMNAIEAVELIRTRDRTGRLLVVGFQGSLSPHVRAAAAMLRSGELGAILNVNALVWQDWHYWSQGTWRENPVLSGGGFMFDTGAHLLNTVADLAGEDVVQVAAWLEDDGNPVDVRAAGIARLASGALITMNGCGRAIPSLGSDIRLFCERGTLRTGIWGERLELQRHGAATLRPVRSVRPAHRVAAVRRRPGRPRWPTRARPRWASGWRGCGTRSASRRHAAAPWSARRARPTPHDGPGHGLERVPPGADRRAGRADLPRRHPRRDRRGPAGRGRRPRRPDRDARRARARARRRRCSPGPTCSPGGATSPTTRWRTTSSTGSTAGCSTGWAWSSSTRATSRGSSGA